MSEINDWVLCEKPKVSEKLKDALVAMFWLMLRRYWYTCIYIVPTSWQISLLSHVVVYLIRMLYILQRTR